MFYTFFNRGRFDTWDGEMLANKGALKVRICWENYTVDLVVTHLVGEGFGLLAQNDANELLRQSQTKELLQFVDSSCADADFVVLGGDFNFGRTDESYKLVREANFLYTGTEDKMRVTWGHPKNTWGDSSEHLLDYVFVRSNKDELDVQGSSTIPEKDFQ